MGSRAARLLEPSELAGHPALAAWRELGGSDPASVLVVKQEQGSARQSQIYRFEASRPGEGAVIAKRSDRASIALERLVYTELLARLELPALRCFGTLDDADPRFAWLFLEAAEGAPFDDESPAHRAAAARWLAALHTGAEGLAAGLPERGPDYFLEHLREGRRRIAAGFEHPALRPADRELLDAILRGLDLVETHWSRIEEAYAAAPRTLVHGDFARRNARVEGEGPAARVQVFDWEVAGRGAPGIDLLRVDLATWAAAVRERWPRLDVEREAQAGRLLRGCLAPIGWETIALGTPWIDGALANLASYRRRLERCLAESGWGPGGASAAPAVRPRAAAGVPPHAHPAARAWRLLGGSDAGLSEVVALRRKPGSSVVRLRGIGPGGSIVAKRGTGAAGAVERSVYESVLPRLPLPRLAFHGAVEEDDGACWLLLEDAGAEGLEGAEGVRALSAWLARLHTAAAPLCDELGLPERGAGWHRERLRAARRALLEPTGNPALSPADRWVLRELDGCLERLDARWGEVEAILAEMPRTLVHGDLGAPNLRARRGEGGGIVALDWETASLGPPAIDLFAIDPEVYAAGVARAWPHATAEAVARWKRCGQLLRGIAATAWEAQGLAFPWVAKEMACLRVYRRELEEALAGLGPAELPRAAAGGAP